VFQGLHLLSDVDEFSEFGNDWHERDSEESCTWEWMLFPETSVREK